MSKSNRLSALEVRIAGHNDVQILLGDARQLPLEHLQTLDDERHLFAQKKTHIEGDLIVATARRVELSPAAPIFSLSDARCSYGYLRRLKRKQICRLRFLARWLSSHEQFSARPAPG